MLTCLSIRTVSKSVAAVKSEKVKWHQYNVNFVKVNEGKFTVQIPPAAKTTLELQSSSTGLKHGWHMT